MEERAAFCPSCGAAQIRVPTPEETPLPPPEEPAAGPGIPELALADAVQPLRLPIQWKTFSRIALPLSVVSGMGIAWFPSGLMIVMGSIVLGVRLYRRRHPGPMAASQGAKLGAFVGFFGFIFFSIFSLIYFVRDGSQLRETMRETMTASIQKAVSQNPDPQTQQQLQRMMHWLGTNQGIVFFILAGMIFYLAALVLLAGITGALSVAFSGKPANK